MNGWAGALHDSDPELTDGVVRLRAWSDGDLECVREASDEGEIPKGTSVPEVSGNIASERVLAAAGFTCEGVLRAFLSDGERHADAIVFSRVRRDP